MIKKLFEKYETLICIVLIVVYVLVNSLCMQSFGLGDYRSTLINTLFSVILLLLIASIKRFSYYGLAKVKDAKKYLYFIPLVFIASVNLWGGINTDKPTSEIIFYVLTMINVGFLEEVIFRGFLFKMMEKDNLKVAIAVNSLTFGIGHVVNLLNGADPIPTLLQICYATAIGFLFVIIFYKSKSLVPCIITHCLVNSLSVFAGENKILSYVTAAVLIVVPVVYALYILKKCGGLSECKE